MRVILTSIVVAVLIAVAAGLVMGSGQKAIYQAQEMPAVRIGDPGHNLVGPDWSGLHSSSQVRAAESASGLSR